MAVRSVRGLLQAAALAFAAPAVSFAADACPRIEVAAPGAAPLATLADVTSATAARRLDGVDGIGFNVRPAAGARLRAYTAANIGKSLSISVDGRARVMAIRDPLAGDAFWITPMEIGEARILAGRVNNCVTP